MGIVLIAAKIVLAALIILLKILGVLAVVIAALLIVVLFCPFFYRARINKSEAVSVDLKITWLLGLLGVKTEAGKTQIRILWFKLKSSGSKVKPEETEGFGNDKKKKLAKGVTKEDSEEDSEEATKEASKEVSKEATKEVSEEATKKATKKAAKKAAKEAAKEDNEDINEEIRAEYTNEGQGASETPQKHSGATLESEYTKSKDKNSKHSKSKKRVDSSVTEEDELEFLDDSQDYDSDIEGDETADDQQDDQPEEKVRKGFVESITETIATIKSYIDMWKDYPLGNLLKKIFIMIYRILVALKPKKIKINKLEIGLEDPAMTGWLYGGYSIINQMAQLGIDLTPNYEEKVVIVDVHISGVLWIYRIIWPILALLFSRPVIKLLFNLFKMWRRSKSRKRQEKKAQKKRKQEEKKKEKEKQKENRKEKRSRYK